MITFIVWIAVFGLLGLLTLFFDRPKKKPAKCQQCDDEYGNCWRCRDYNNIGRH